MLNEVKVQVGPQPHGQLSVTDADARSMATSGRGSGIVGFAGRGYYSALQIKACADSNIASILPKPTTSGAKAEGRFDASDFIYIAKDDE